MGEDKIAIEVHNLTIAYDKAPVIWDVDFEIPKGQIVGVIGPNGSGKTTMLKTIMGLMKPASGNVKIFGTTLDKIREKVAYVPQRESVDWDFPASVMDIVLMGRYRKNNLFKRITKTDKEIALNAIEKVKLTPYKDRQISQLSGGQQQRVFIARALAQGAELYLMDEPFVGVDASTETAILELLIELKKSGKTVVIIHHDLQTVSEYFDHIVLLNTRLIASGPTAQVLTADNLKDAYGGQLTVLAKITEIIKEKEFPIREKGFEEG